MAAIVSLAATEQELIAGCCFVGAFYVVLYEDLSFDVPFQGNTGGNALIFVVRIIRTRVLSLFGASRFLPAHGFTLLAANLTAGAIQLPDEQTEKGETEQATRHVH